MRRKKRPATRNPAAIAALVMPRCRLPWCMASAAFRNQTAAPTYQIQLKLRPTLVWDAPHGAGASFLETIVRRGGRSGHGAGFHRAALRVLTSDLPRTPGENLRLPGTLPRDLANGASGPSGTHPLRAGTHFGSSPTPVTTPFRHPCAGDHRLQPRH